MILPKSKIRSIAEYKLANIKQAKKCLADFLPCVFLDGDVCKLARSKIAKYAWNDRKALYEEEWEHFKTTDQYKIAEKLVKIGKFSRLRDAVDFVCDD